MSGVDRLSEGLAHHHAGNLAAAEQIYRETLASQPNNARAMYLLGVLARQANHPTDAAQLIERAIEIEPDVAEYHAELGETWIVLNDLARAVPSIRRALELDPQMPAYNNLGHALLALGKIDEAIDVFRRGTHVHPNDFIAFSNLGAACSMADRADDAVAALRRATELNLKDVDSLCNLAIALRASGRADEALDAAQRAVDLAPGSSEALNTLGDVLLALNDLPRATEALRRALEINPHDPVILSNLAVARQRAGHLDASVQTLRQAIAANPHFPEAWHNYGISLLTLGDVDEAANAFRGALTLKPSYVGAHDALLLTSLYRQTDLDRLLDEHRRWETQHAEPLRVGCKRPENDRDPNRRLRIGYVSGDFRNHPVATFIEPLLAAHDLARVEVYCYSDVQVPDTVTARIHAHAPQWRDINGHTDAAVAAMIRADRIDILVDLSLHSGVNRLLVFARKPAPVQVSYLGYSFTPGLSAIDYRFTDEVLDPPAETQIGPERPWRLPEIFCCYQPPADAPDVSPEPIETNGYITLGSFNKLPKITNDLLALWARLLKRIPTARLLIQAQGADQASFGARINAIFQSESDRVTRRGLQPMTEYLRTVSSVDIALDTFPFNGHTTTCHALWMGVPIVTLTGALPLARVGRSLLTAMGLQEFATNDAEAFLHTTLDLCMDRNRVLNIRQTLRQRMRQSALMDAPRFARNVEHAFGEMWLSHLREDFQRE